MVIPIPIPIGVRRVATARGAVWKVHACENCRQQFAFLLELQATGEDHDLLFLDRDGSSKRAQEQAEENLLKKSQICVVPVPCPNCGFYQEAMSRKLKEDAWTNRTQFIGGLIVLLSLVPLAFNIEYIWLLSIVLAVFGLLLLAYGYVLAYRFDPNAGDPEPRKSLGRLRTVWGKQLDELNVVNSDAPSSGKPND